MVTVAATATLLATSSRGAGQASAPATSALSWAGLVGSRPQVATGGRVIVVLRTPSLAQRVAAAGGSAGAARERAWTGAALAAQKQLISRLAAQGVTVRPDYSFSRVLDGFSAVAGGSAVALLERDPAVAGVYPVRIAYPASVSTQVLARADFGPGSGHRPGIRLAGADGRGVTVALLDTGVDAAVPYLRGRVRDGIDVVGGDAGALAAANPASPSELERHGTEMAGLLVGGGGPSGLAGVAGGATVLPIRVAGWQPDSHGGQAVYARSDQLIAGLDRAVDPNDDGDASDAVRVALVPLAEPFAGFPDGPEARAVAGALALDTLVVAPAGNDGAAGTGYGDVSGPGGAPAALTVGAADTRPRTAQARLDVRSGLATLFAGTVPLAGAVVPPARLSLEIARPLRSSFFSARGVSLVAGRAAFVAAGLSPLASAERAVTAGASAVLLDRPLPAGGLGLDESAPVPVVSLPSGVARALRIRLDAGAIATVSLGSAAAAANAEAGRVASFSSTGLAFDGRVKPDLVAPGVALATSDPGANADGSPRFVTVNGSSAAAAIVAGAAALLAQARPALDATALAGLLSGTARALPDDPVTAQGSGLVDVGAAAAGRLAAAPATLAFGRSGETSFTLTNLSGRDLSRDAGRPPPGSRSRGRALLARARPRGHPPGSERCRAAARARRAGRSSDRRRRRRPRTRRRRDPRAVGDRPGGARPAARSGVARAGRVRRFRHAARAADRRRRPRARRLRRRRDPSARSPRRRAVPLDRRAHRTARPAPRRSPRPGRVRAHRTRPRRDAAAAGEVRRPRRRNLSRRKPFE